jgi:hypothetical protein
MKQILAALENSERPEDARVLARVRPETIADTRAASRVEWMPLELNREFVRAITAELGVPAGEAFFHRIYAEMLQGPVFSALFRGIRALGARSPGAWLKHAPRGYAMIFRDVGRVEIGARTENSLVLEYHELPLEVFEDDGAWVRYAAASYLGAFDVSATPGGFRFIEEAPDNGFASILFEW